MSAPFDFDSIRPWTIRFDPASGRPASVEATPEDSKDALTAYQRVLELQLYLERAKNELAARGSTLGASPATSTETGAERHSPSLSAEPITISSAFDELKQSKRDSQGWSAETVRYTYAPSIRIFRELVGRPMPTGARQGADDDGRSEQQASTWDLPLVELTASHMKRFVQDFRRFPARQGKRGDGLSARDALEAGGPPQSFDNLCKRLEHIRLFLTFCVEKHSLDEAILTEINLVLRSNTPKAARKRRALERADENGVVSDGYVSFSETDLKALFGSAFKRHVKSNAARYWVPLIGLYTGMRLAEISQLGPDDFVSDDGIPCIRVRAKKIVEQTATGSVTRALRIKTEAAARRIPLHPALIELGLLDYVAARRDARAPLLWDGLMWRDKEGYGKYPGRDFTRLAKTSGVHVEHRKVFHSFRSTFIQALEKAGLQGDLPDRLIGHEVKTTRMQNYNRTADGYAFPTQVVYSALCRVAFPIDVPPWSCFLKKLS